MPIFDEKKAYAAQEKGVFVSCPQPLASQVPQLSDFGVVR